MGQIDEEIIDKYRRAGKIASEVRNYGIEMIKPGVKLLDIVEKVESKIYRLGGEPAFPVNISIDRVAAHFSPRTVDAHLEIKEGNVVKLDVGVHVDGYIADTASTVEAGSNSYEPLISSTKLALERVIESIRPGIEVGQIGRIVYETIKSKGFNSIRNLSGHSLDRYVLHSGISIPNFPSREKTRLNIGDVVAIEPFASTGSGYVESKGWSNIYRFVHSPLSRDLRLRFLSRKIKEKFRTLPFADRWFTREFPNSQENFRRLISLGCVYHYPKLVDDGIVSQHEHTLIITEDGCEVTT